MTQNNINLKMKLIDITILITVITIITVIAYPLYKSHVISTKRAEAKIALFNLVGSMERYFSIHNTYDTATINKKVETDVLDNPFTIDGWYRLEISSQTNHDFVISAIPQKKQAKDDLKCAVLSISKFGEKKITGIGPLHKCW